MTAPPSRELRRGGPVLSHTPQDGAQSALHWQETPASSPRSTFLPRRAMTCPPGGATELSRPALPRVLQAQRRPGSKHRLLRPGAEMRGPGTVVGNLGRGTWPCLKSRRGGGGERGRKERWSRNLFPRPAGLNSVRALPRPPCSGPQSHRGLRHLTQPERQSQPAFHLPLVLPSERGARRGPAGWSPEAVGAGASRP